MTMARRRALAENPIEEIDEPLDEEIDDSAEEQQPGYEDVDMPDNFDDGGMFNGQPSPMEKHNDLLKELTNFDPYVQRTFNSWLGRIWDDDKQDWVQDPLVETPDMNMKGAKWALNFIQTYARNNNIITHIGDEYFKYITDDVIDSIFITIYTRKELFGIKDNVIARAICYQLYHISILVLLGAVGGKYNDMLTTITSRNENVQYMNNPNMMGGQMGMLPPHGMQDKKNKGAITQAKNWLFGGG